MFKKLVKLVIPKDALEFIQRLRKELKNFRSLAQRYGQWTSIKDWKSVDETGGPMPWYTYPATEYLSHLNLKEFSVFEYGSGNSTLWWAKKAKSVISVEDDSIWFERIRSDISDSSVKYLLKNGKHDYVSSAEFAADIFIVDGKHRRECAEHIMKYKDGLMIILDNSDWYPKTVDFLQECLGWVQIDFHGFGPINDYTWTTTLFINPTRHQELKYERHLMSKCGIAQVAAGDY